MNYYKVFYYHPLDLTFKSAQTLQVIKDYYHLSKLGVSVVVYGSYENINDLLLIQEYVASANFRVISRKRTFFGKIVAKVVFFWSMLSPTEKKTIVTRHYRKLSSAFLIKKIISNLRVVHEMHEESFPYLFKTHIKKEHIKSLLKNKSLDCLIFTNYSQQVFFKQEFECDPIKFAILPNGVEFDKFQGVTMSNNFVLTYLGQFNHWKNVELIFKALSLLDKKYTLRIAGGKGDNESEVFIKNLMEQYNIDSSRVCYLGFINNHEVANKVLKNSNVLLLPLGDNIQSKFLTSPMKLFEYMATSIPVLSVDYPSVRLIASEKIFFSSNDAKSFASQIENICNKSHNFFNFDSMNVLARQYSYKSRSNKFLKEVISEL
ncbi:MAG TPA: glycosyltransferase [Flavobacteriales bacterium]|jgi:glycosyltransferase involved in cell wall biosynthesis|nr:glycosyltransferase [Flavobacteriales bacterium]